MNATVVLALSALCMSGSAGQPGPPGDASFERQVIRLAADLDGRNRFYSITWSEPLLDAKEAFLRQRLDDLMAADIDRLDASGRVDFILVRNNVRADLAAVELARRQLAEMADLLEVRSVIVPLEEGRWRMERLDSRAAASELARIPGMIKGARERLDAARKPVGAGDKPADAGAAPRPAPVSPVVALRASRALTDLDSSLRRWFDYHQGFEPEFAWWCTAPYEAADKAIDEFAKHLREEVAGVKGKPEDPLIGDPIGRAALLADLRREFIAFSPEELIAVGEKEFSWCEEQMKAASREMGLGDDWKRALDRVKERTEPPGEQAEYVAAVAREAVEFVKAHDLLTVPPLCDQTWRLHMLSTHEQRTLPYGVYLGQAMGVAYPHSAMNHDDKLMSLRGNNRHFVRIVTPHELIPGHHLQGFVAQRERPYRRRFSTPFYVEGWALYWEMKLWDMEWAKSPEDRIGMLFWRMHRCARIAVSLKFHLGEMTPPEMIDYLVDRVGHERSGATAEVRRFIGGDYSPLYQCGYMIGGKQVRALWREVVGGGAMTEKAFNDAVLRAGPIPIELLRAELLSAPLAKDGEAQWRAIAD